MAVFSSRYWGLHHKCTTQLVMSDFSAEMKARDAPPL